MSNRPSSVRHVVVASAVLMSVLLYLDRFCVSFAELYMKQDLGLTDMQVGWMFSAFFWAYALAQVPSGWMTDRWGARVTLTVYILGWSACVAAMGLAQGIVLLLVARFACGLFQAGAYPTGAAILARWVPLATRGLASSLVALGGRLGGALAPLLTALLIVAFVPTRLGGRFEPGDIFAPGELCQTWLGATANQKKPHEHSVATTLFARLTTEEKEYVKKLAAGQTAGVSATETQHKLAGILNRLLDEPDLFGPDKLQPHVLSYEGQRLLKKQSLEPAERQRLNRLVIETLFTSEIRRVYTAGWRPIMFTYGLVGIPIALLFWSVYRNRPEEHPWCNELERRLVSEGKPQHNTEQPIGGAPIGALAKHFSMWCNSLSQFATNVGWIFLVTWLPRYLDEVHRVPVERRAWMTLTPILIGFLGLVAGGRLTDRLVAIVGLRWGRALPMGLSKFLAMGAYLLCLLHPSAEGCVVLFAVVAFASDMGIGAIWAYAQDVGGRHVGSVLGWANMWGNIGAAIGPVLLVAAVGETNNWDRAFLVCAGAYAVAAVSALLIDAEKPLLPQES
ncbi:MAG: hypothetical protein KatS3mg110_2924 [Pirellulaceae bacterium]|nr:MAG: hypothetical protein KatS3mg110_2924 [Pirellulaceae bacterium]